MPTPSAASSTRTSPICQSVGARMLNRTTTSTLNATCPTTKLTAAGVYAATNTSSGSTTHHNHGTPPVTPTNGTAISTPSAVPASASNALRPVAETLLRNAESVPNTTQNANGREPPQPHPERERDGRRARHEARDRHTKTSTQAVAQPD